MQKRELLSLRVGRNASGVRDRSGKASRMGKDCVVRGVASACGMGAETRCQVTRHEAASLAVNHAVTIVEAMGRVETAVSYSRESRVAAVGGAPRTVITLTIVVDEPDEAVLLAAELDAMERGAIEVAS